MSSDGGSSPRATTIEETASKSPSTGADGAASSSPTSTSSKTAGVKRPAPASKANKKDGEQLSEKKLRRLEKNRLSARECRRRKREATENMERQINLLNAENLRLRLQLQVCESFGVDGKDGRDDATNTPTLSCLTLLFLSVVLYQIGEEAEHSNEREQFKLTEGLDALLKSGASESEIFSKIEEYKEKFADYGRDRRSAIEFHLRNVERLLQPTQTTSVVMATLQNGAASLLQPPDASTHPPAVPAHGGAASVPNAALGAAPATATNFADTKSLFSHLVQILDVTPEQAAALKDSRFVAHEMDMCLQESLGVLKELQRRLTQCGEGLDAEFSNVRSILTPTQAAKFLVWVANNSACMHMLNELWSKVYPHESADDGDDAGD